MPASGSGYKVYVDDNAHHGDTGERYLQGEYPDCESAVRACKAVVEAFLQQAYGEGKDEAQLWREYTSWGEDPFIVAGDSDCRFSAWDYAKARIREMAGTSGA